MGVVREWLKKVPGARPAVQAARRTIQGWRARREIGAIRQLRGIHKGRRAFVIGNGPSLTDLDLSHLAHEITFGVNGIWLLFDELGWQPTYYTVEDCFVAEDDAGRINQIHGPVKIFPIDLKRVLKPDDKTFYIRFQRGQYAHFPRFSDACHRIVYWGGTVTTMNLQLAHYFGCNPIYLIGMDMNYQVPDYKDGITIVSREADVNHFHPDYFGPGKRWHDPRVDRMKLCLGHAGQHLAAQGVEVLNATRGGQLDCFRRVDYDSLFDTPSSHGRATTTVTVPQVHAPETEETPAERARETEGAPQTEEKPETEGAPEPNTPPDLSVIVCTHNRGAMMESAVRSLLNNAGLAPHQFEVIVVANNCTDDTDERLEALQQEYANLRWVHETGRGLSMARNRGIVEARSENLAFFDDDIFARPDYAEHMVKGLSNQNVLAIAARVQQDPDAPCPSWMRSRYKGYIATALDLGNTACWISAHRVGPVGAAMAVRRSVFDRFGLFRTDLGRQEGNLLANEELVLFNRIKEEPQTCRYIPRACVIHYAHAQRASRAYMLRRAYWKGVSNTRSGIRNPFFYGIPKFPRAVYWMIRGFLGDVRRLVTNLLEAAFLAMMSLFCHLGALAERIGRIHRVGWVRRLGRTRAGKEIRRIGRGFRWCWHVLLVLFHGRPGRLNVQIQTTSICNASCVMCPYPESWQKHHPGKMTDELFERILTQLEGRKIGKLCLYLENEPLVDAKFLDRLQAARDRLRFQRIEISTNASALTPGRADQLADILEPVPHELWLSFHGYDKASYERTMGLDFDRTVANVVYLLQLADRRDLTVCTRGAGSALRKDKQASPYHFTPRQYTDFWERLCLAHGIEKRPRVVHLAYHDRAGSIKRNEYNFEVVRKSLFGFYCERGDQWLHVLYNGEVVLCCNDYHRRTVIGDLNHEDLDKLLVSPAYRRMRKMMMGLKRSPDDFLCKRCSKPGG